MHRQNLAPWFHDHVYWDADLARRWVGADIDHYKTAIAARLTETAR